MKKLTFAIALCLTLSACQPGEMDKFFAQMEQKPALSNTASDALKEADAALSSNDYTKAKGGYEAVLAESPDYVDALEGAALCEMNLGQFAPAVEKFNKVLAKRPKSWRSLNAIAVLHVLKGQLPQAGEFFIAADKASPQNPAVLNNWGLGYAISGNIPESVRRLTEASAAAAAAGDDAKRKQADFNLALVHALHQQDEQALAVLRRILPEPDALRNLAAYANMRGDAVAAQGYLKRALAGGLPAPVPAIGAPAGLDAVTLPPMSR